MMVLNRREMIDLEVLEVESLCVVTFDYYDGDFNVKKVVCAESNCDLTPMLKNKFRRQYVEQVLIEMIQEQGV